MKSKKYQLKNGLKVLLIESKKSPVVSVQMWVKNGSADERKGEEGLSHFIEHLVFKGTKKYRPGEIAAVIEGSGGELNAYTSFDQTVFYVTISKSYKEIALDVISEMMGYPTFDKKEVDNEREVVIEEIKMGMDSPGRKSSQQLFNTAFQKHPYGIPVIGYEKNIKKTPLKKIVQFYKDRYSVQNMMLVVCGDFETAEMKKLVDKYYSGFQKTKLRKVKRKKEPQQTKPRLSVETSEFHQSTVYAAWKAPKVTHKDVAALDVMSFILGQGDSSRLVQKMRIEKPITNSVGAWAFNPQDEGLVAASMGLDKINMKECFKVLNQSLIEFMSKPPTAEELQKAVTNFASEQIYSVETVDGIARKAGSLEFYMNDFNYFEKFIKQVYSLKPEDIVKVARKYFNPKTLNLTVMTNENKKKATSLANEFIKEYSLSYKKLNSLPKTKVKYKVEKLKTSSSKAKSENHTHKMTLNNGIKLFLRKQSDSPTVSLKMGLLGGLRNEADGKEGLTELFSRTWAAETKKFSEEEINKKIDNMAAGLGTFAGRNSIGINLDYLSSKQEAMLEIARSVILEPTFSQKILDREKVIMVNQIRSRNDNPGQLCGLQFTKEIYKGHPYAKDLLGTEETINSITTQDILEYYNEVLSSKNFFVSVVGDFEESEIIEFFEKLGSQLAKKTIVAKAYSVNEIKKELTLEYKLKREQTHIIVGYRGLTITDPDRYAASVIQSILAGQGGRLFIELRDKNSLAYSVAPMRMEGIECGYFGGYIACSPEKTKKAIAMMKDEFKKLCDEPLTQQELNQAKQYIIGRHDIDLQRKSTLSSMILFDEIYGLDSDEGFNIQEKYEKISIADIQRVAKRIFCTEPVISIVGP